MHSDSKTIKENANHLFMEMKGVRYTFEDLLNISNLSSSDLCLALIQLVREDKVIQSYKKGAVYYQIAGNDRKLSRTLIPQHSH